MKALKTIGIILLVGLAILFLMALFGEKHFRVERSEVINAPAAAVYSNVSSLGNMEKWAPWKYDQHNLTDAMKGNPDGTIGAIHYWKSDESEGEQELAVLEPNEHVLTKLRFLAPFKSDNEATFDLEAMGDSTKVIWGMQGDMGLLSRFFGIFMSMEKAVGPMFEKGLDSLEAVTEREHLAALAATPAAPGFEVTIAERPTASYIGFKSAENMPQADIEKYFMENVPKLYEALGKAKVQPTGPLCGLYYDWNQETKTTHMMLCVPVAEKTKVEGLNNDMMPAGKAYATVLHGGPSASYAAHMAVDAKLTADGMVIADRVLEEYVVSQGTEPDSNKWVTNIIYMVKPK